MSLNIKHLRDIFPPNLKTLIYEVICVNKFLYLATIKNDNGAVAMRNCFCATRTKATNPPIKKGKHRGIKDLMKCAPMFLVFYFDEIEGISRFTK